MTTPDAPSRPAVFVTVGTDHHPFDRLIRWIDGWLEAGGRERASCFVQFGTSEAPRGRVAPNELEHSPYVGHEDMARLTASATAVVCHGGPGTIMDCLKVGTKPIVVPRRHAEGEHVDDHQVRFTRRLQEAGYISLAESEADLRTLLDDALADPGRSTYRAEDSTADTVHRFSELARELGVEAPAPPRIPVLFIGGWGRSGSTLLERLLAQVPGFISVGEMRDFWLRGYVEDRLCGCGERFRSCEFWSAVGQKSFGGWEQVPVERLIETRMRYDRPWTTPMLATGLGGGRALREYLLYTERLYRGIHDVAGGQMIIDSSKIPTYAMLLRRIPSVDLRVLHLVRDSRGVVFSWQKQVLRPDATDRPDHMRKYGVASASARYLFYNQGTDLVHRLGAPYLFVRYEDLVRDPTARLLEILRFAGVGGPDDLGFLRDDTASLAQSHTVDGNPMRFATGPLTIRVDEEWRSRMGERDRAVVSTLTAPLLHRYGYEIRRR